MCAVLSEVCSTMGVFSTMGDIMMHVGGSHEYRGDVQYCGGYHEYHGGYHEYHRGYLEYCGGIYHHGDVSCIMRMYHAS